MGGEVNNETQIGRGQALHNLAFLDKHLVFIQRTIDWLESFWEADTLC